MTYQEILKEVSAKRWAPVYFLHGEESYFIDSLAHAIEEHALTESEKGFNQTIVYGKDVDAIGLLDVLRRYPMMSERQVVLLREAQDMKTLGELATYVANPMPTTLFVISYKHKKYDLSTKFGKALKSQAVVFESKKLYDNQLPDWIQQYAQTKGLRIDNQVANLLSEYLGTDLAKVSNELDKLALNLANGSTVSADHVQEYIGISKEYNLFELQKALALRDMPKLARIAQYLENNVRKNPLIVVISSLHTFFAKTYALHFLKNAPDTEKLKALDLRSEWFLKDYKAAIQHYSLPQISHALHVLRTYDLRAKGIHTDLSHTPENELLREMLYKLVHP